jgi:TolB-like protein
MASLIPGFEYDIFISYRQKDNKYDGWVTEFVDHLKKELEATFKEEISVYFDINPHDGLLETHDVNASLKEKLKCLVFIPVISQTYCDSKSFAWQHELCAFNKLAKEDQFGRDIKLTSGNIASRILPVKIHDIDAEDNVLLENELGGVLRAIEFIYKSAGVNRPLRSNEDHPQDNLNKTYYRDQINKVANAIKEIITAIRKPNQQEGEPLKETVKTKSGKQKKLKPKIIIASLILPVFIILGFFFIPKLFKSSEPAKRSIAVLPFKLLSNEPDKQYLADGMTDAILLHLSKINDLRVLPKTSVEQYRETSKAAHIIGRELDVEYLLEGSFQKSGNNVKLIVQLIDASKETQTWANEYNRNWQDIFSVQSEVAQSIAGELHTIITPREKKLMNNIPTADLTAYDLYLKANEYLNEYQASRDLDSYKKAITFYTAALETDSTFARAYTGLASLYYNRYYNESYFKQNFLDTCLVLVNTALSYDDQREEAYYIKGEYCHQKGKIGEALENFDKSLEINPNYYEAYYYKGYILTTILGDYVKGIDNYQKALPLMHGEGRPSLLRDLGDAYRDIGLIDKAKYYYQEAFAQDGNRAKNFSSLSWVEFSLENFEEALEFTRKANEIDSTFLGDLIFYSVPPGHDKEAYLHAKKLIAFYLKSGVLNLIQSHRVGYAFYKVGEYKEAENFFNQQIKYSEESIKLGRDIAQSKSAEYDLAATYAFKGDREKAYQYLDEYNTINFHQLLMISLAKHDPLFAGIRNEERFQKILQAMVAKNKAESDRVRKWLEENNML